MARQYNLKDINGLHLKSPYDYDSYNTNGISALIENFDFYPLKSTDITDFEFINSSVRLVDETSTYYGKIMGDGFIGDNSYSTRTHDLDYSQIKKIDELVKGEKYYTKFNFYFNFSGEDAEGFDIGSTGYTITVSLYAILGNTKRKLKLSDLRIYDYKSITYGGTTDNPVDAGYVPIGATGYSLYNNNVELNSDDITASYFPRPRIYDIYNNTPLGGPYSISYSYVEGDSSDGDYGNPVGPFSLGGQTVAQVISFGEPSVFTPPGLEKPRDYNVVDNGYAPNEISPFNIMDGGPLFRVTAQLDATDQAEFDANICKGNKDFKIMVDYNGTVSKTIITYVEEEIAIDIPDLPVFS